MSTIGGSSTASWLVCAACAIVFSFGVEPARGESDQSPAQYVNLPGEAGLRAAGAGARTLQGGTPFSQLVNRGVIMVRRTAPTTCLPPFLRNVLAEVAVRFGAVSVESTHRTRKHNGRAGGARHSLHLSCRAVDLRVRSRQGGLMSYLRSRLEVGGLKIYRTGIIHIDNGERRTW